MDVKNKDKSGYNDRLFLSGGLRSYLHFARFKWLKAELIRLKCSCSSVLELGCFDGRAIEWLPRRPWRYLGLDANWEGGLDSARNKYGRLPGYMFKQVTDPSEVLFGNEDRFQIAIAMETLEHVPPEKVQEYLAKIAMRLDGYLFITVPNEKGLVFLLKHLTKRFVSSDYQQYTFKEILNAFLGRMQFVARNQHKGFDWTVMVADVEKLFDVVLVQGVPFGKILPPSLCFGVGVLARKRSHVGSAFSGG
jgi:SAM-dependent methyltransferase